MRATAALLAVCVLTIGCGNKTEPQAKPEEKQVAQPEAKPPEQEAAQPAAQPPAKPQAQDKGYLETVVGKEKDVKVLAWLLAVRQNIAAYQAINGAYPKTLDDLNKEGLTVPPLPTHMAAKYDPKTGKVDLVRK